jgi:hypothetical protein
VCRGLVPAPGPVEIDHRIVAQHPELVGRTRRDIDPRPRRGRGRKEEVLLSNKVPVMRIERRIVLGHFTIPEIVRAALCLTPPPSPSLILSLSKDEATAPPSPYLTARQLRLIIL